MTSPHWLDRHPTGMSSFYGTRKHVGTPSLRSLPLLVGWAKDSEDYRDHAVGSRKDTSVCGIKLDSKYDAVTYWHLWRAYSNHCKQCEMTMTLAGIS